MTLTFTSGFVTITPLRPVPLAGYGARTGPSTGIADELEANAVIVRDGDRHFIAIAFDLLYVGEFLRQRLEAVLRPFVEPEYLFLAASHTHFGPATDPTLPALGAVDFDYLDHVVAQVASLIASLVRGEFKPLHAGRGRAQADHAVNRRRLGWRISRRFPFLRHGISMAPNPHGIKDETIHLLRFGSEAAVWNYACHPVFVPHMNHVSADFIGVVRQSLRARLGAKTAVLFWQGFSGDVYPSFAATLPPRLLNFDRVADVHPWASWARRLAEHVARAYANATPRPIAGPLRSSLGSIALSDLLTDGKCQKTLRAYRIQIGPEIDILGVSAELVTAYAGAFREKLRSPDLLCVGCVDGVFGYLPTAHMLREGGYEAGDFLPYFSLGGSFRADLEQIVQSRFLPSFAA